MSHQWRVIGRVYKDGNVHGNIIGLQGNIIEVEPVGDGSAPSLKFTISTLEKAGYRIEWANVKPVGVYHGEF